MSHQHRLVIPATSYFFTVRLEDARSDLLVRHIELLRHSVLLAQKRHPFTIDDAVILPNRIHMIWSMPAYDMDYGKRWQMIKATFARHIPHCSTGRAVPRVWQRRYWEHPIRNTAQFREYADLIAQAPVTDGLAERIGDWPYATASKIPTLAAAV